MRLALIFVILGLCGCVGQWEIAERMGKGDALRVPPDLRRGTATFYEVQQWAATLSYPRKAKLTFSSKDLNLDGRLELLVSTPQWAGTGGNQHLVFEKTPRGYHYMGDVWFGAIRPFSKDESGQTMLLTSSHISAGSVMVSLLTLDQNGFHTLGQADVAAGDSGTEEGNRIADELFGEGRVSPATLEQLFGAACSPLANR